MNELGGPGEELPAETAGIQKQSASRSYYYSLRRYTPIFYSGKGVPLFLILKQRPLSTSLPCVIFINVLALLTIALSFVAESQSNAAEEIRLFKNINILVLLLIDIFYGLTVSLNPGIVSEEEMELSEGELCNYCHRCTRKINNNMKHCIECEVCVTDLDHHCSFFGKCIAGLQRFAFYGFLTFMFAGFICLLGSISLLLAPK